MTAPLMGDPNFQKKENMEKYYKERFTAQRQLVKTIAPLLEADEILETIRSELRRMIPHAMEACILLLDPDAGKYTRPLQCALYDRPVNCLNCKRNRLAIQKALAMRKTVVVPAGEPVVRHDKTRVSIGPEAAIPVFDGERLLAVVSVVAQPDSRFPRQAFFLMRDFAETVGVFLVSAKKHWADTQEKIRINRMLTNLASFVPQSVRKMVEQNPELLEREKEKKDVSILFVDIEGYTRLSTERPDDEVNALVERFFSGFVDPIHRYHGDINETAGDGLMIIFKDEDPCTNAVNSVRAAIDIRAINLQINREMGLESGPINVNMGINTGKALVGMTRMRGTLDTRMTYTASGPVTNLAARLAEYAQNGDILIGSRTAGLVQKRWPLHDRGNIRIKGIDKPVHVYSPLGSGNWKLGSE